MTEIEYSNYRDKILQEILAKCSFNVNKHKIAEDSDRDSGRTTINVVVF